MLRRTRSQSTVHNSDGGTKQAKVIVNANKTPTASMSKETKGYITNEYEVENIVMYAKSKEKLNVSSNNLFLLEL